MADAFLITKDYCASTSSHCYSQNNGLYDPGLDASVESNLPTGPPPSLVFGGYDANRAYGDFIGMAYGIGPVDLLDITINVLAGFSPFEFKTTSGSLLPESSLKLGLPLSIGINPYAPYISLHEAACVAIAKNLPVMWEPTLGLYLWNTTSPYYDNIVNSASALSFAFKASILGNVTISVPFRHLNLTF
jgi:hypothetical protein